MKNRRAVGLLNPMRDKNRRQELGGRRDDTCDHGLSRSWKVDVCLKKKKKNFVDRQSIRSPFDLEHIMTSTALTDFV